MLISYFFFAQHLYVKSIENWKEFHLLTQQVYAKSPLCQTVGPSWIWKGPNPNETDHLSGEGDRHTNT